MAKDVISKGAKIYTSPTQLGLSVSPTKATLEDVSQAMPDGSIGIFTTQEVDDSVLTPNDIVTVILLFRVSNIRMFAWGARSYANVNLANTRLFFASHNSNTSTWIGWKEFSFLSS